MAKLVWICVLAFMGLVTTSWGLQCLKCNDCENEPSKSSSCLPGFNSCVKSHLGGKIRKFCAPEVVCSLENIDRSSLNPLKNLKTIFSDEDMVEISDKEGRGKGKAVHCCDSDFCNGSTEKRATLGLLLTLLDLAPRRISARLLKVLELPPAHPGKFQDPERIQ